MQQFGRGSLAFASKEVRRTAFGPNAASAAFCAVRPPLAWPVVEGMPVAKRGTRIRSRGAGARPVPGPVTGGTDHVRASVREPAEGHRRDRPDAAGVVQQVGRPVPGLADGAGGLRAAEVPEALSGGHRGADPEATGVTGGPVQ